MGGLFCKQRSRSRPQHSAQSRRKKLHRVHCLLRGPCLLCFIVHGEHPTSEAASPDLPAAQDCARLLLLCPGELSTWQERHLCGGLLKGPGLLCTATSQQTADDMLCKRKNCGENQQSLTPCKQPRCTPTREQAHPHGEEDLSLNTHCEGLSSCSGGDTVHPQGEDLSPHFHSEDLSSCTGGETACPQTEDLSPHPRTGDPSTCPGGQTTHPQARELSSRPRGQTVHPNPGALSSCPSERTEHPMARDMAHSSGGLTPPCVEVLAPPCSAQKVHCQGKWQLTGNPALACTEQHAHSLPGNMSHHSIEEQPPSSSGDLATTCVEDREPHCSGVKTLQCLDSVFSHTGEYAQQLSRDPATLCTQLQLKPANVEPLRLGTEDHGQTSENSCCSNKLSSCCTMCQDHIPSSLATFSHVDLPSSGCNQAAISQSPKVEGEVLVPCEPLNINQLPPSLLLKVRKHDR